MIYSPGFIMFIMLVTGVWTDGMNMGMIHFMDDTLIYRDNLSVRCPSIGIIDQVFP